MFFSRVLKCAAALMICLYARPGFAAPEPQAFANNLAQLMGVSAAEILPHTKAYAKCAKQYPDGPIAKFGDVAFEASDFAAREPFLSTKALLSDFTRQLIITTTWGAPCKGLAELWDRHDPFVRQSGDRGIGLSEADIKAAEALDTLRAAYFGPYAVSSTRERLLALWDQTNHEEHAFQRIFLTRFNAWTPAVEQAWEKLSEEEKRDATLPSYKDQIPEEPGIQKILNLDEIGMWLGGANFSYTLEDISKYQVLVDAAGAGFFGGAEFAQYIAARRQMIETMNYMMMSQVGTSTLFDLMDMNADLMYSTPPN